MAYKDKVLHNPRSGQDVRFIQTAKDTNGLLLEMEATWRPGSTEPPQHYHPAQEEDFYVIDGEITVRLDGKIQVFKKGDTFHVAAGKNHSMWNDSTGKAVLNWKVMPAKNTEQLLETGMGLAKDGKVNQGGMPGILQIVLTANRFSNVYRTTKPPFFLQKIIFIVLTPIAWLAGYRAVYKKYID